MNTPQTYTLEELLTKLDEQKTVHLTVTEKMMSAYNAAIYPLDLMGISVSKRSMSLIRGFIEMIRQENFICAAPLVRMQLDNSLRFYAAFLVDEPHKLATEFINGNPIRNLKERLTKQKLTDRLLVERLAEHHPWITAVYEKTSGYIHLSEIHLFNAMGKKSGEEKLTVVASDSDSYITEQQRTEAVYIMIELTTIVLWLLHSWTLTKDTPNQADWIKKQGPGTGYKKPAV